MKKRVNFKLCFKGLSRFCIELDCLPGISCAEHDVGKRTTQTQLVPGATGNRSGVWVDGYREILSFFF